MSIRAFLFDMDGLLVDTESLHLGAFAKVAENYGIPCKTEDLYSWVGKGQHRLAQWIVETAPKTASVDRLLEEQRAEYFRLLEEISPPAQPGVKELLDLAHIEGIRVGLVSNSDRVLVDATLAHVLKHLGQPEDAFKTFEIIVTRDDVENAKPAPDPYRKACADLGLKVSECMAFEDSPSGAQAARAAELALCVVPCPFLTDPTEATDIADVSYDSLVDAARERPWARL